MIRLHQRVALVRQQTPSPQSEIDLLPSRQVFPRVHHRRHLFPDVASPRQLDELLQPQLRLEVRIHLLQRLLVLHTPRETLSRLPRTQTLFNAPTLLKHGNVDQGQDVLFGGEEPGRAGVALAEEIVDEEPVEARVRPAFVSDIGERRDLVELGEVVDPCRLLGVQGRFLGLQGFEFALEVDGLGEGSVQCGEGRGRVGGGGGLGQGDVFGDILVGLVDQSLGGFEVLAEELVGNAEEGLVEENVRVCV